MTTTGTARRPDVHVTVTFRTNNDAGVFTVDAPDTATALERIRQALNGRLHFWAPGALPVAFATPAGAVAWRRPDLGLTAYAATVTTHEWPDAVRTALCDLLSALAAFETTDPVARNASGTWALLASGPLAWTLRVVHRTPAGGVLDPGVALLRSCLAAAWDVDPLAECRPEAWRPDDPNTVGRRFTEALPQPVGGATAVLGWTTPAGRGTLRVRHVEAALALADVVRAVVSELALVDVPVAPSNPDTPPTVAWSSALMLAAGRMSLNATDAPPGQLRVALDATRAAFLESRERLDEEMTSLLQGHTPIVRVRRGDVVFRLTLEATVRPPSGLVPLRSAAFWRKQITWATGTASGTLAVDHLDSAGASGALRDLLACVPAPEAIATPTPGVSVNAPRSHAGPHASVFWRSGLASGSIKTEVEDWTGDLAANLRLVRGVRGALRSLASDLAGTKTLDGITFTLSYLLTA